jgi:GntR family transcriptional regulator
VALGQISDRSATPKYQQLAELIRERISCGEFAPGDRLPSESELGSTYQISRVTTRQALADLERDGLLDRVPGKGTFVRSRPAHVERPSRLTGFRENLLALGLIPTYRTLRAESARVSPMIADRLNAPSGKVYVIERVLLADGDPVAFHISYLPLWLVQAAPHGVFTTTALDQKSLYQTMADAGARVFRADEIVEPGRATPTEAAALGMEDGELVLRVARTVYDQGRTPLEYVEITYRADAYTYRTTIYASGSE